MADPGLKTTLVTNTIPPFGLDKQLLESKKVEVLDAAPLFPLSFSPLPPLCSLVSLVYPGES
jgi:hypothetical protein